MDVTRKIRTIEKTKVTIDSDDIKELLISKKIISKHQTRDVEVYFDVPSGGDWSGMAIELNQNPLRVEFTTTRECKGSN